MPLLCALMVLAFWFTLNIEYKEHTGNYANADIL